MHQLPLGIKYIQCSLLHCLVPCVYVHLSCSHTRSSHAHQIKKIHWEEEPVEDVSHPHKIIYEVRQRGQEGLLTQQQKASQLLST